MTGYEVRLAVAIEITETPREHPRLELDFDRIEGLSLVPTVQNRETLVVPNNKVGAPIPVEIHGFEHSRDTADLQRCERPEV